MSTSLRSMTGYGTAFGTLAGGNLTAEISSLNRKQLEITINLPAGWGFTEPIFRETVAAHCSRGAVKVSITYTNTQKPPDIDFINASTAYFTLNKLCKKLKLRSTPNIQDIIRFPGVVREHLGVGIPPSVTAIAKTKRILSSALCDWNQQREREGEKLRQDIETRLSLICKITEKVSSSAPRLAKTTERRLHEKLRSLFDDLPKAATLPDYLRNEVISFVSRGDYTEEVTRLRSHLGAFKKYLIDGRSRHLEFLAQEILRELNTIASKCADASVAHHIVNAKAETEKIREQLANLE